LLISNFIFIDSGFNSDYILDDESLNVKFFLDLRQRHDAYSGRKLERTKAFLKNNDENDDSNKLDINKASSLVSCLTKNESVLIKSRENRWKSSGKTGNITPKEKNSLGK
jgi:hypothetical protein